MNKKYWIRLAGFAITMVTLAGAAIVLQNPILAVVTLVLETALAYGLAPIFFPGKRRIFTHVGTRVK
jgi:hypothetical protein